MITHSLCNKTTVYIINIKTTTFLHSILFLVLGHKIFLMITLYCPFDVHLNRNQISCKHLKQFFLKSNMNIIPLTRRTNLHKNHVFSFTFSFSQNILQSNDDVLSRKSFPLVPKLLIWFSNDVVF